MTDYAPLPPFNGVTFCQEEEGGFKAMGLGGNTEDFDSNSGAADKKSGAMMFYYNPKGRLEMVAMPKEGGQVERPIVLNMGKMSAEKAVAVICAANAVLTEQTDILESSTLNSNAIRLNLENVKRLVDLEIKPSNSAYDEVRTLFGQSVSMTAPDREIADEYGMSNKALCLTSKADPTKIMYIDLKEESGLFKMFINAEWGDHLRGCAVDNQEAFVRQGLVQQIVDELDLTDSMEPTFKAQKTVRRTLGKLLPNAMHNSQEANRFAIKLLGEEDVAATTKYDTTKSNAQNQSANTPPPLSRTSVCASFGL